MIFDSKLNRKKLNPNSSRRGAGLNGTLLILLLIAIALVAFGVIKKRKHADKQPPAASAALPAPDEPLTPPAADDSAPAAALPLKTEDTQPLSSQLSDSIRLQLDEIQRAKEAEELLKARELSYGLLKETLPADTLRSAENLLGEINIALISVPVAMPEKTDYIIKSGDSLARIAKQFNTTVELLQLSNNIKGHLIRPGDVLRIFTAPFTVEVDTTKNELVLYAADNFFKRYRVGTGKYGTTPKGVFEINDKISEPPWWRPDGKVVPFGNEENVLGTRWLSLKPIEDTPPVRGYGIHGTWEPETIGKQASAGCVRLLNKDVEELYALLPLGVRVVIKD